MAFNERVIGEVACCEALQARQTARAAHAAKERITMGRKLFVGNLSYNVGEAELHALFDARTPNLEGIGEVEIAKEAATLKVKALTRLAELGASS